jgi:glycosyltransferase involved in cell wall biosynthesis
MKLMVINYSMASDSLVFSHQSETVLALAEHFESVTVFTSENTLRKFPSNVKIITLPNSKRNKIIKAIQTLSVLLKHIQKNPDTIVFTHMTDVHAALLSPFTWLMRVRHVLWYAHAHNSPFLIWASFFVSEIVTSTPGSCNLKINKRKVNCINQGIREEDFPFFQRSLKSLNQILYYGRLDPSKNIHLLVKLVELMNKNGFSYTLDIYGGFADPKSEEYLSNIKRQARENSSITINGPIERHLVSSLATKYHIFLNLFSGSLDKTLIESTLLGLPVVTWNKEYCNQFGTWSKAPVSDSLDFVIKEMTYLHTANQEEIVREIHRRLLITLNSHTFNHWIINLSKALNGKES